MQHAHPSSRRARAPMARVVSLLLTLLLLTPGIAQGFSSSSFPGINLDDIPGLDRFTDSSFLNCMQGTDNPATCLNGDGTDAPASTSENQGILSMVENDYGNPLNLSLPPALDVFFGDLLNLPPAIHLMHEDAYEHCHAESQRTGQALHDCAQNWQGLTVAAPDENYDKFSDAVETAWAQFNSRMINDLHRAINTGVPCVQPGRIICSLLWLTGPPTPIPDFACAAGKVLAAYPTAFATHYGQMWADILAATVRYLPNTVAYGLTFNPIDPLPGGSLIAPIADMTISNLFEDFSLDSLGIPLNPADLLDPAAAASLDANARQNLYYHEALITQIYGIVLNTPILPGDLSESVLGIEAFEEGKRNLAASTGIDYEAIGYMVFSQLTAPMQSHTFQSWSWSLPFNKPSIEVRCLEGGIPTGMAFPFPVPSVLAVPDVGLISVPEGGVIPHTAGPLQTLF